MTETFDSQSLGRRVNELLILCELGRGAMHGYQIALDVEERSGGYFPFSHGTLYPILHRLEKDGVIVGRWSDPEEGRPRKEYVLTAAGRTRMAGLRDEWRDLNGRIESFLGTGEERDGRADSGAA